MKLFQVDKDQPQQEDSNGFELQCGWREHEIALTGARKAAASPPGAPSDRPRFMDTSQFFGFTRVLITPKGT